MHQQPILLSETGQPLDTDDLESQRPTGYMFDVGGLVLAMGWQPSSADGKQLLAVATVPHSDQDHVPSEDARQARKMEGRRSPVLGVRGFQGAPCGDVVLAVPDSASLRRRFLFRLGSAKAHPVVPNASELSWNLWQAGHPLRRRESSCPRRKELR